MNSVDDLEKKKNKLRSDARRGKWSVVFETFKNEGALRKEKITTTGDTVLHIAVSSGGEKVVANMVDLIGRKEKHGTDPKEETALTVDGDGDESVNISDILGAENERHNTPLHLAASIGKVGICKKISDADPSLVGRRNIDGETPLFLAALHGKKKAFLWLHYKAGVISAVNFDYFCVRKNGDSVLHCAIAEGHFDVAIEIILLYKDLVKEMRINKEGLSPLHLLAAMPSAFESTSLFHRPIIGYLIYHCIHVKKKEEATKLTELEGERQSSVKEAVVKLIHFICFGKRTMPTKVSEILHFIRQVLHHLLEILELAGWRKLNKIRKKKEMHTWSLQIMDELLRKASDSNMSAMRTISINLASTEKQEDKELSPKRIETPLMIAARNGVTEMVRRIVELFPSTINDVNEEGKNIVLLAAERRQTQVYQFLYEKEFLNESLFQHVDIKGNSALHLAARLGDEPWLIRGEALQMQWEIKWFKFVKKSVSPGVFRRYNKNFETPDDIFSDTHKELVRSGGKWLNKTSQACSVVSTLIATVAFATTANVPGGIDEKKGYPNQRHKAGFTWFASSSLGALCCSLTATFLFLSILTSRYQALDFHKELPRRLIFGMTSLFVSIAFVWLSFCVGHSSMLDDHHLQRAFILVYILASIIVTIFVLEQFPLYLDLLCASFTKVPAPSQRATPAIEYRTATKNTQNSAD